MCKYPDGVEHNATAVVQRRDKESKEDGESKEKDYSVRA
jgi:hypothetical protein